jgi:hypothetical protein
MVHRSSLHLICIDHAEFIGTVGKYSLKMLIKCLKSNVEVAFEQQPGFSRQKRLKRGFYQYFLATARAFMRCFGIMSPKSGTVAIFT